MQYDEKVGCSISLLHSLRRLDGTIPTTQGIDTHEETVVEDLEEEVEEEE
jgi:hypothetical protein